MKWPGQIDCRQASVLLSAEQDQRLPAGDRIKLTMHLWQCDACEHFQSQLAFLRQAMQQRTTRVDDDQT